MMDLEKKAPEAGAQSRKPVSVVVKEWFARPQVWGFFLSLAAIVAISLAFFAPDNFDGNTLSQPDMLQGAANSHEAQAYEQATGEKALWTNSLFSGMPTFQISPSYPSNSLFTWLNSLYGMFLPSPSNLLCMMMLGFLILLYCMGKRWYYALIGAVAWGFSTYFIIIIGAGHIWKFVALSYIPPTIGGLVLCYRGRWLPGAAITALFGMLQFNANHPQMSYYFAFVMAGLAIAYLCYAVRDKKVKRWLASSAIVLGSLLLAVGANLPSLYNSYEYAKETQRAQSEVAQAADDDGGEADRPTGGMPKKQIVGWSYGKSEMFSLFIPNVKGGASARPEQGAMSPMSLDKLDKAQELNEQDKYLMQLFTQYFNDSEGTNGPVYVGALVFALFLLGCFIVKGPLKWALLVLTVLSMLLALGKNLEGLTDFMIYNFPLYNKFRAVESILVIAEFTIPLLAVLALIRFIEIYSERTDESARQPLWLYLSFGFCIFFCLVGWLWPAIFGSAISSTDREVLSQLNQFGINAMAVQGTVEDLRYGLVRSDCLRSLMFLVLGAAALWAYSRRLMSRNLAIATVGLLVLVDLYSVNKRYVSHDSFLATAYAPDSVEILPDEVDLAIMQDNDPHFRVMDFSNFTDARRSYFHKMIGGYHSAKLGRYDDLITTGRIGSYNVLDMLNAKYFIGKDENGKPVAQQNPYALGNVWLVDEIEYVDDARAEISALDSINTAYLAVADKKFAPVLGTVDTPPSAADRIELVSYSPNTLEYTADTRAGGIAVFSEIYFPWGWKATIDGNPAEIGRVNYVLRAIRIPAGQHRIVMTFAPDSVRNTVTVAYVCIAAIYLLAVNAVLVPAIRRRRAAK